MIAYLLQGVTFGFAAAVQPGPFQAYYILQTLQYGWRRTIALACVPLLSDLPVIVLVVFVLAALPASWVDALRIAGGAFLLYLAARALASVRSAAENSDAPGGAQPRGLLQAALINLLNPNPYLFWGLVTGPILIEGWKRSLVYGIGFVAAFYAVMIAFNAAFIRVVSTARAFEARVQRVLIVFSAAGLAAFGVYQLWMGIAGMR